MEAVLLWTIPVVLTMVLGAPPLWQMWRSKVTHVRSVWARIEPVVADDGEVVEGRLSITNGSEWPVWDVIVLDPPSLEAEDFESVGPAESRARRISADRLVLTDPMVTVQVEDHRRRRWMWTPLAGVISPIPARITPLARLTHFVVSRLPEGAQARFSRLPQGLLTFLWGYNPEGGDADHLGEHLLRVRPPGD